MLKATSERIFATFLQSDKSSRSATILQNIPKLIEALTSTAILRVAQGSDNNNGQKDMYDILSDGEPAESTDTAAVAKATEAAPVATATKAAAVATVTKAAAVVTVTKAAAVAKATEAAAVAKATEAAAVDTARIDGATKIPEPSKKQPKKQNVPIANHCKLLFERSL